MRQRTPSPRFEKNRARQDGALPVRVLVSSRPRCCPHVLGLCSHSACSWTGPVAGPGHQPPEQRDALLSTDKDRSELGTEGGRKGGPDAPWKQTPSAPKPGQQPRPACVDTPGTSRLRLADGHPRTASLPAWPPHGSGSPRDAPKQPGLGSKTPPRSLQTSCFLSGQEPWVSATADAAGTQILKSKGRADGASLAQMSRASGLHSGPAPQISATERPQKASRFIGGLRELYITVASHPDIPRLPGGQIIPQRASCQSPHAFSNAESFDFVSTGSRESPYWAPGFRSNVPLKGPEGTLCPCSCVCMIPDPARPLVLLEATACPTLEAKAPDTPRALEGRRP